MRRVLIANRGEIAVRIARTLREMGLEVIAVYSEADRTSLHVRSADEAYAIGPAPARESYLRIERILDVARRAQVDAIHPGYGFLSENPDFAEACEGAGIAFIGPPASAIRAMGNKTAARARMAEAAVPIVPGGPAGSIAEAARTAGVLGYPVMLKAAAGGGGKGMRYIEREAELAGAWESARSVSREAFGDETLYLEKVIVRPRHVEIQVLADAHGNAVHLFERDCSIQRRHQKVVEETPCPVATPELVEEMGKVAVRGARAVGYRSAGTFEFLLGGDGRFYFLEMNTRLQVEHPITEWTTGIDLVREMVRVAGGERLGFGQEQVRRRGASIECRIYAEDPESGFLPSPGLISSVTSPAGPGVRDDSAAYAGAVVSRHYDPLVSKLSVWGPDRPAAIARLRRALDEYRITGIRTNLSFHRRLAAHPAFAAGAYDTGFIAEHEHDLLRGEIPAARRAPLAAALAVVAAGRDATAAATARPTVPPLGPWVAAHRARLAHGR